MMPAIVTVSLSAGPKFLAAKVLVKRLVALEDLGNIEILFTDKTGTLTEGVITFERGIDPEGNLSERRLLLALVCNEATVTDDGPVGGNSHIAQTGVGTFLTLTAGRQLGRVRAATGTRGLSVDRGLSRKPRPRFR
jgi:P-type E1-E2 ATPase